MSTEIVEVGAPEQIAFASLDIGQTFTVPSCSLLHVKIDSFPSDGEDYPFNTVCINNGTLAHSYSGDQVFKVVRLTYVVEKG